MLAAQTLNAQTLNAQTLNAQTLPLNLPLDCLNQIPNGGPVLGAG